MRSLGDRSKQRQASQYYNKIDTAKIAVAGMSCGGLQTFEVAPDSRVTTAMICDSGIFITPGAGMGGMPNLTKDQLTKLHTPVIYILGGQRDIAYDNGMDDFHRIGNLPAFAANLDVGHGGTYGRPHGGEFAVVATAWFQWQLKADSEAAKMFEGDPCGVAKMPGWKVEKKNIPLTCRAGIDRSKVSPRIHAARVTGVRVEHRPGTFCQRR